MSSENKKYQVFVSSTFTGMGDARQELMMALLSMGMMPTGMELRPQEQGSQWNMIQQVIAECDYYVVLLGGRYGPLSPMGLSYIHREYVFAATKKKPVIAFIHDHPETLPLDERENSREGEVRFQDFRKLLREKSALFRHWNTPTDLAEVVRKSMPLLVKQAPAVGWVRGTPVADINQVRDIQNLKKRIEELEKEKEELTAGRRPPVDTLARGTDKVALQYSCNAYIKGDCKVTMAQSSMTWDTVFATVGPQMMHEVPESVMREALEEVLATSALSDVQQILPKAHAVRNVVLSTASFNQVKIQLRALGLIRKTSQRDASGQTGWQLTPHGDQTMTQVLAQIRR